MKKRIIDPVDRSRVRCAFAATSAGCTMKSQDTPPLTGPRSSALSITLSRNPDDSGPGRLLAVAGDHHGPRLERQAARETSRCIAEIFVGGVRTDFGSISARNLVTDANGERP